MPDMCSFPRSACPTMPELPEVETTVRGLAPVLEGRRIASIELRRADLRRAFPPDLRQRLTGARVTGLGRRAKYGLIDTDRGDTLVFHLGMSGRWRIDPAAIGAHDHVAASRPRRAGGSRSTIRAGSARSTWSRPTRLELSAPFAAMGPEPLGDAFDGSLSRAGARRPERRRSRRCCSTRGSSPGLGNIYVCEALHLAGIAPGRAGGRIARPRLDRLAESVKAVLLAAIEAGGSTLRDYAQPDGELGYFSSEWRVYGREGRAVPRCGTAIRRRDRSGGRPSYCPKCQR